MRKKDINYFQESENRNAGLYTQEMSNTLSKLQSYAYLYNGPFPTHRTGK